MFFNDDIAAAARAAGSGVYARTDAASATRINRVGVSRRRITDDQLDTLARATAVATWCSVRRSARAAAAAASVGRACKAAISLPRPIQRYARNAHRMPALGPDSFDKREIISTSIVRPQGCAHNVT